MPKTASLDESILADALVGVVDDIRREVHGALGTRPWRVEIVTRRWSGSERGVGNATTTVLELDPPPKVERVTRDRMGPAGREASGNVVLTGVSLAYAQEELQPPVDRRSEFAYRLTDLRGSRMRPEYFVIAGAPIPRRGDKPGDCTDWYIRLEETTPMGVNDGVSAP